MNRLLSCCMVVGVLLSCINGEALEYRFANIADTSTSAPDGGTFTRFSNLAISGEIVAFRGTFGAPEQNGIFTGSGGSLTTIAKSGDPGPVGTLEGFAPHALSGNTVAFRAAYSSVDQGHGIFTGNGGPLTTIVKKGDPPFGLHPEIFGPGIDGDTVVFESHSNSGVSGIITSHQGQYSIIAAPGDAAPSGTFHSLSNPAISGNTVAFRGHFQDVDDPEVGVGIFTKSSGVLTTVAKTGDPAPSGSFEDFSELSLSGDRVAFLADFGGNSNGVFAGNGGLVTTIAKMGDPAPVGVFSELFQPTSSNNAVAFLGFYNDSFEHGIFVGNGGPLTTVIKTGDPLFGSTVSEIWSFFQFDSVFGMDPHSGNIAFRYELSDGKAGIAVANLVPEPSTLLLIWIFATAGLSQRDLSKKRQRAWPFVI